MNIAWNLIHGNLLWFNLKYAFVPHPPLFFIIVGMLLKTFGNDLIVIRSLIAFYGILTAIVLFYTGKELKDERLGLLMSFLFATYPNAIFFGRIGYANNQLALLSTLVFFLCLKYHKHKNKNLLFVIPLLAGLAPVTEFGGLAILLSVNLFFLLYDKKNMRRILIISIIPLTLYIAAMLLISPNAFLHDIFFNSQRLGTLGADKQNRNDPIMTGTIVLISIFFVAVLYRKRKKIIELYQNLALFIFSSFLPRINIKDVNSILKDNLAIALFSLTLFPAGWILSLSHKIFFDGYPDYFLIGLLGLLFVPNRQARNTVFLFFIPSLIYFLRVTRTDHMMLPLYPYMIIGLAFLILWLLEQFKSSPRLKNIARPASILIMV
ncbi:MAG: glycosyltransferase family 39 protein, partial [Candidatus Omnitrophica bacterium]|nr:glycosyltransferase family 39 protein [Candidatus Omnitrophota bacterium]